MHASHRPRTCLHCSLTNVIGSTVSGLSPNNVDSMSLEARCPQWVQTAWTACHWKHGVRTESKQRGQHVIGSTVSGLSPNIVDNMSLEARCPDWVQTAWTTCHWKHGVRGESKHRGQHVRRLSADNAVSGRVQRWRTAALYTCTLETYRQQNTPANEHVEFFLVNKSSTADQAGFVLRSAGCLPYASKDLIYVLEAVVPC